MLRQLILILLLKTSIEGTRNFKSKTDDFDILDLSHDDDIGAPNYPRQKRTHQNIKKQVRKTDLNVTTISANLGKSYKGFVDETRETVYNYEFEDEANATSTIRVTVSSVDSSTKYPVLFVVQQQRSVLSWQVPLELENVFEYCTVSRTLCPVHTQSGKSKVKKQVLIQVFSMNPKPQPYTLRAFRVSPPKFILQSGVTYDVVSRPSEPVYYQYKFPDGVDSVVVKVTAPTNSSFCSIISVQNIHCPVFDLDRNIEYTGQYQSMTTQAAITVERKNYDEGMFFVVIVVKPRDYNCKGIESVMVPANGDGTCHEEFMRIKQLQVTIETSITRGDYIMVIGGTVGVFLIFYVLAVIIVIWYWCRNKDTTASFLASTQQSQLSDRDSLPIMGSQTAEPVNYGTSTGDTYAGGSNDIPHRISPTKSSSDDTEDIDTYDLLPDAEREKDIFRTKTFLYVADLARKDAKNLSKKYKLYYWNLLTIAIFYGLPVIQLVVTYQKVLHVTGDEDICYYNFLCAHPLGVFSAFNNVFSNIGYIMLGLLFLGLVWNRERTYKKTIEQSPELEKQYGIPQHFGLFYSLGIALVMEGIMSGCYHVCPNYSNFQFDTAFMYMIGGLCMLKIYQTRHPDINANAYKAYMCLAVIIFLVVIGVVYGNLVLWIIYSTVHILSCLILTAQVYYMGRWKCDLGIFKRIYLFIKTDCLVCARPMYKDRLVLLIIGNLVNIGYAIYGLVTQPKDFASYLLAIFIINFLMYSMFYITMKIRSGERILLLPCIYIVIACVLWGFALYFFLAKLTTWQLTAARSREGNKECTILNFYDDHDIWHFISSMSLFISFMILLTLDDDLITTKRDTIPVF
ncbi:unnamed protein product [Owenia fusiformis]|uniref:Uncharacterized protein n=1 Tax=Owenia fusiformis TaxID=6347 RepID=A0A8J1XUW1_OWEFU|nr:unnamed protein product [Owenia fusiformis]